MKATLVWVGAAFIAIAGLNGCRRTSEEKFVVYDEWWAADFAAGGCRSSDQVDCRDDARAQEADFLAKFSAAFATDPTCSGVHLVTYRGPKTSSEEDNKRVSNAYNTEEYVTLMVSFTPGYEKQSWMLSRHDGNHAIGLSGEGTAAQISHEICAVAKKRGGNVN